MERTVFCPLCSNFEEYDVKRVKESYPVKGEEIEIMASVSICKKCGNEVWNEELDSENLRSAYNEFRRKHKLLTPQQIKATREKYGISQSLFARALGLGEKTITRYERGSLQDRSHNGLILLADKPDAFKMLFETNQELLSTEELSTLIEKVETYRVKVIYGSSEEGTVNYSPRSSYAYNVNSSYFGGLNDAS